ncbi:hypothetical protein CMI37_16265 [Candidatus Pacearchaeota archaeon]|nr:hypothetical protein [Candidatus Pacearchaeota archaeon]|tara:strand:+ start:2630 stop:3187 length:558 start_codon:yes stop_codon:yes gene_type:complete
MDKENLKRKLFFGFCVLFVAAAFSYNGETDQLFSWSRFFAVLAGVLVVMLLLVNNFKPKKFVYVVVDILFVVLFVTPVCVYGTSEAAAHVGKMFSQDVALNEAAHGSVTTGMKLFGGLGKVWRIGSEYVSTGSESETLNTSRYSVHWIFGGLFVVVVTGILFYRWYQEWKKRRKEEALKAELVEE